ncbi:MAG: asparagine synthase (glutamine-hydrolyzing) [Phycisphaeraceae bacterium]|nr:asparagine synthase (glutamine-hydrolyzing) [Phycisphaeraceae bacterium]
MCGIFGIFAPGPISLSDDHAGRLRDLMAHRGPDGAGLWRENGCLLAHRRLAVLDPSDAAAQPMRSASGRFTLVYNGELYNDLDLRRELHRHSFTTSSDTETILAAFEQWGTDALRRFRGMYALALYDSRDRRLLLARDPLGIKPLSYRLGPTADGPSLLFASEPRPILEHPDVPCRPDWITVSAYLSTIRTVLGERTLFEGVRTVRPGESLEFTIDGDEVTLAARRHLDIASFAPPLPALADSIHAADSTGLVETQIRESIIRHLRADVPLCCMLSGGLDSSIIAATAKDHLPALHTYCSGADSAPDFPHARLMSQRLGSHHTEAPISRECFAQRWPELVTKMGLPLSTPNEVAINEIARRMRAAGHIVTLSGEGADELFAGYELPILDALRFEGLLPRAGLDPNTPWLRPGVRRGGEFQLAATAWIQPSDKPAILAADLWRAAEHDDALRQYYTEEFDRSAPPPRDEHPLQPHLRFLRRINLTGLLARLDTATMLEGVESRTPFADAAVAALAESLPIEDKFTFAHRPRPADPPTTGTKVVLRRAFAPHLPHEIVSRPKASFPLPMQDWVADLAPRLRRSRFARDAFTLPAIEAIAAAPDRAWHLAWPVMNVMLWGEEWWGT